MKADRGIHTKGDIVEIRASGTPFGGKEPNSFVLVEVLGVPMANYEKYSLAYNTEIDFSVVASDLINDKFRLKLYSPLSDTCLAKIGLEAITWFVNSWGGVIHSNTASEVLFDIGIYEALVSPAFWELDFPSLEYTELEYNQTTGIHRISVDYSSISNNPTYIEKYVVGRKLTIVSHSDRVLVYDADRLTVNAELEADIKQKTEGMIARRRYCLPENIVDVIINADGTYITDETTLLNYVTDKSNG